MREPCCEASDRGFSCLCRPVNLRTSRQAEDDGYADWKNDQEIEGDFESPHAHEIINHSDPEGYGE